MRNRPPAAPNPVPSAEAMLLAAKLRRTPVRLGLLELLRKDPHPLSAQEILERLPAYTDAVTVYRSLTTLTAKGLLHRVRGDGRVWRFGIAQTPGKSSHEHAHFVCDECGTVECVKEIPTPPPSKDLRLAKGYGITYSELLIHGTCPRCDHRHG